MWRWPKFLKCRPCATPAPFMKKRASANAIFSKGTPRVRHMIRAMTKLLIGNAPCSWGTLEFEEAKGEQIPFDRMLDELAEAGYTGTELGDWGYLPTDPSVLRAELLRRGLVMLGAFVPVALKDSAAHPGGIANAVKTARLLAAVATTPAPYLVLADQNGSVPERTRAAGRVTPDLGLTPAEWNVFVRGAGQLASAV